MTFDALGLLPESLRAVADQGYLEPTPVQSQAIPAILAGRDVLVGAQTGTGKTAAFVLPMLQRLGAARGPGPRRVRGLVVVPTRELALQVEQSIHTYGAHRPIRSVAIYGGVSMDRQVRALRAGAEIVVATPGRLLDHVRQRTVDLGGVEVLVLDEADRMLDMGFIHDIRRILALLPKQRQSLLFSATFNPRIRALAEQLLRDPESIDVAPRNTSATPIRQVVHPVDHGRKRHLLSHLIRTRKIDQVLVFTRTKRGADRLAEQLGRDGIAASAIHGNKSQPQRVRTLAAFKSGHAQVLVATDIAARGLDIQALPHVVNYELPSVPEDYVHRIGRTGRAGLVGTAISLVAGDEHGLVRDIERLLRRPIEREIIEGYEPGASGPGPAAKSRPERRDRQAQRDGAPGRSRGREPRHADALTRPGHARAGGPSKGGQLDPRAMQSPVVIPGERIARHGVIGRQVDGRELDPGSRRRASRDRGNRHRGKQGSSTRR